MDAMIRFLQDLDTGKIASDPMLLAIVGALVVAAVIFRWKSILLLVFGIAATMAVVHYSRITTTPGGFDKSFLIFVVGCVAVGVILVYFLFIRGD